VLWKRFDMRLMPPTLLRARAAERDTGIETRQALALALALRTARTVRAGPARRATARGSCERIMAGAGKL